MGAQMLPRDQWRVVNLVYAQMMLRETRNAALILKWSTAELSDLVALEQRGLLRATHVSHTSGTGINQSVSLSRLRVDLDRLELTLTPAGVAWWTNDRFNKALYASLWHKCQGAAPLAKISAFRGVSVEALTAIEAAGLVSISAGNGCGEAPTPAGLRDHAKTWRIGVTAAGRYVLGA